MILILFNGSVRMHIIVTVMTLIPVCEINTQFDLAVFLHVLTPLPVFQSCGKDAGQQLTKMSAYFTDTGIGASISTPKRNTRTILRLFSFPRLAHALTSMLK